MWRLLSVKCFRAVAIVLQSPVRESFSRFCCAWRSGRRCSRLRAMYGIGGASLANSRVATARGRIADAHLGATADPRIGHEFLSHGRETLGVSRRVHSFR